MGPDEREMLTEFFRNVALDPLDPGDPRYVRLYDDLALLDEDPVAAMADTVVLAPGSSVQLLSGYRGSGKTTELSRLKQVLEADGYLVAMVDVEDYLNTAVPVDITEFLMALAGSFDDALRADSLLPEGTARQSFWDRLGDFVSRVRPSGIELGPSLTGVKIRADIRESTEFTHQLREAMASSLGALVTEVRSFVAERVEALLRAHEAKAVVLVVDSIEHFRGTSITESEVQASIERLFGNHAEKLYFRHLHVVYTVPPYLKVKLPNLASYYEPGAALEVIPALKVRDHEGKPYAPGLQALEKVLAGRGDWERVLGPRQNGALERVCTVSGGQLRDLMMIMQEILRRARRADRLPVSDELVESALNKLTREMLPIADNDAVRLWRIHEEHDSPLEDIDALPVFARFVDTHLVLVYRNGKEWYDVHPLVEDDLRAQVERIRRRDDGL